MSDMLVPVGHQITLTGPQFHCSWRNRTSITPRLLQGISESQPGLEIAVLFSPGRRELPQGTQPIIEGY